MSVKAFFIGAFITVAMLSGIISLCRTIIWPADNPMPATCSIGSPHPSLATSHNPSLKKLAEYELLCKGAATSSLMTFAPMPITDAEAIQLATTQAEVLKELSDYNLHPIVVFEPSLASPTIITDIKNGLHDRAVQLYFETLKNTNLSSEQMGTWVLFPEANTPTWHNTSPEDFTTNVQRIARIQKTVFPESKNSILLNSWSYPSNDISWSNGELKSLLPYVENIPSGLIDSIGLQGFPYKSPASETTLDRLHVSEFLPDNIAGEAARSLGVKTIWLNTGTFSRMYTNESINEVQLSANERGKILNDILDEAGKLQKEDYEVSINIFAQNKADLPEHVDWSYWPQSTPAQGTNATVLELFLRKLQQQKLHFSLYDTMN
jgi:hypothetical protein